MKHTPAELKIILRDLIMSNGLSGVMKAIEDSLEHAMTDAYRDYETTNLRSSLDLAKAWKEDTSKVRDCRIALG
jgi:hypothetical protein